MNARACAIEQNKHKAVEENARLDITRSASRADLVVLTHTHGRNRNFSACDSGDVFSHLRSEEMMPGDTSPSSSSGRLREPRLDGCGAAACYLSLPQEGISLLSSPTD